MRSRLLGIPVLAGLALAGCTAAQQRNATTGAVIGGVAGAATGAAVTGDVGGAVAGGAIGATAGGVIGAAATPRWCRGVDRAGNPVRYRC